MNNKIELAKDVIRDVYDAHPQTRLDILLAGKVLVKRIDELEKLICDGLCNFPQLLNDNTIMRCDNCEQCLKVKELLL